MLVRVSGAVLASERVHGTSREGSPYDFTVVSVLVAGRDVTRVQIQTANAFGSAGQPLLPVRGELVDWLCEVGIYRNEPSVRIVSAQYPLDGDALLAS